MSAPIKLTNSQLESVAQGLAALDGLNLKDCFVPFKFDDETTWSIAVKTVAVQQAIVVLNQAKKSLAKQNAVTEGMKITPENAESVQRFMESLDVLMAREAEIGELEPIPRAKLNLAKNAIPPGVLARLMPVLE